MSIKKSNTASGCTEECLLRPVEVSLSGNPVAAKIIHLFRCEDDSFRQCHPSELTGDSALGWFRRTARVTCLPGIAYLPADSHRIKWPWKS